jgi:aminocarboxymuconate-semialdehyde decarboxylase
MSAMDHDTAREPAVADIRFAAREAFFRAERRVEDMEARGVTVEVLSPLLRHD